MSRNVIKDTSRAATSAVKTFVRSDPVLVRKKMEIKDVYYKKSEPKKELFRFELAFDTEQYFLVAAAVVLLLMMWCGMMKIARRRAVRKARKCHD